MRYRRGRPWLGLAMLLALMALAGAVLGWNLHRAYLRWPPSVWFLPDALEGRVSQVLDGDTFDLDGHRVRLFGVKAPAGHTPQGKRATAFMQALARGAEMRCQVIKWHLPTGRYRTPRAIATCRLGEADVGALAIRWGHALEDRRHSGGRYKGVRAIAEGI